MDKVATQVSPQDGRALRQALGRFATGVTVITTGADTGPLGITANSFASVSLDPPLVLWAPAKSSSRFKPFTECDNFAIHVAADDQVALADTFVKEGDAFDKLDWWRHDDGTPLIEDCLARFHCTTETIHDAGDHVIVIGRVLSAVHRDGAPLIFAGGKYGQFTRLD
ncbi:flavin reductase family protein [Maribius pontilimi]|uniref:Flavin reductase family protein n=1 Tax=Palleronia pontilimi TaxID=1964209 RepID=A0A934IIX4_9RHOB|nr:flavin reductase family protein [Palleronia pontilimi]MBJ3762764.1 flavin reductase family protein [Palleronia pontilimi]